MLEIKEDMLAESGEKEYFQTILRLAAHKKVYAPKGQRKLAVGSRSAATHGVWTGALTQPMPYRLILQAREVGGRCLFDILLNV
jgi:hypothetical protein